MRSVATARPPRETLMTVALELPWMRRLRRCTGARIESRFGEGGERGGARTHDPVIKSHVLYRLSYALPRAHLGHRGLLSKPKSPAINAIVADPAGGEVDLAPPG
jgi:hypothetical protein